MISINKLLVFVIYLFVFVTAEFFSGYLKVTNLTIKCFLIHHNNINIAL